jgi:hypothetical protein
MVVVIGVVINMNDYPWLIRDYQETDFNFVKSCFLRGLYYGDSWFSLIPKDIFMHNYSKAADVLILSPKRTIKIACVKDDPDTILGYSIMKDDFSVVDFVFVKKAHRKQGIGKSLVPQHPKSVSHLTTLGKMLLPKLQNCVFNPFEL